MRRTTVSLACVTVLSLGYGEKLWGQDGHAPAEGQEAALIAVLKSSASENERADACRQLGRIGTKASVAPLAALLTDDKLSHMARYALEPIPDSSVDDALRKAADKLEGRNLVGVIGSIGVRRDVNAIELLGKRLKDRDADVVQAAARALGSLGPAATGDALLNELPGTSAGNRGAFYEGLLRCGEALSHDLPAAALAIYDRLDRPQMPRHIRDAAAHRARLLRQEKGQTI
jgi:HEAT repeat protein